MSRAFKCNVCKRFFDGKPDQEIGLKGKDVKLSSGNCKTTEIKDSKDCTSVLINYGAGDSAEEINWSILDFCPDCTKAFDAWRHVEEAKY
jgi:hypothetical protein